MNCNNCGAPLVPGDQFCKNCGTPVSNNSVQNQNVGVEPVQTVNPNVAPVNNSVEMPVQNPTPINIEVETPVQSTIPSQTPINGGIETPVQNVTPSIPVNNGIETPVQNPVPNQDSTPMPTTPKQSNNNIIFIIIGVVMLIIIIVLAIMLVTKDGSSNNVVNSTTNNTDNGEVTPLSQPTTYQVYALGHSFDVPTDVVYEKDTDKIAFGNEAEGWVAQLEVAATDFTQIVQRMSDLATTFQSSGYQIVNTTELKNINGKQYIVMDLAYNTTNLTIAITELSNGYIGCITLVDVIENQIASTYLESVNEIISTANYVGTTSNMEISEIPNNILDIVNVE